MSKTQPIKDEEMLKNFRNYYRDIEPNPRNYALIVFGLNSALRISDILGLCWNDVYSDQNHRYREHIAVWEQKNREGEYSYCESTPIVRFLGLTFWGRYTDRPFLYYCIAAK